MKLKLEHLKDYILSCYEKEPNVTKIAKQLSENQQAVSNVIKRYGTLKGRPYQGDTNYFSKIDSYSKAYIVGFITADGSLVKTTSGYELTITLKHTDRCILDFIKSQIGNEHKIQTIKRKSSFDPNKDIHHNRYAISNPQISNDLLNLGIKPNKSLDMENIITNIPFEYRDAFIIGYFDGDGSVSTINSIKKKFNKKENIYKFYPCYNISVSIRGTQDFLQGVCEHLDIKKSFIRQYDSLPSLTFANKKDVLKIFNCYKKLDFFLQRKYDIFLSRVNHSSYDKYK